LARPIVFFVQLYFNHRESSCVDGQRHGTNEMKKLPADELDLFRDAVRDVQPRPTAAQSPIQSPKPRPRARFTRADQQQVLLESLLPVDDPSLLETGDELSFRRDHVPSRVLQRLRRGEYAVAAEMDLHGMTAIQARTALADFIKEALYHGYSCVRVVHGKGRRSGPRGPVLKNVVNLWLRKCDVVMAFGSARPIDGGSGAVYVLLRTR
jgi:DNA-nicking Smr family endonuclease